MNLSVQKRLIRFAEYLNAILAILWSMWRIFMSIKVNNWVKDEPGIYVIENEDNGMRYVGKAIVSCKSRIEQHIKNLKSGKHSIERLQHDYDVGDDLYFREIYAAN